MNVDMEITEKFAKKYLAKDKDDNKRLCSACKKLLDIQSFSKKQLRSSRVFRKCNECIKKMEERIRQKQKPKSDI